MRGDMGSGWGTPLTITQNATQLVVEHALFSRYDLQPPLRFVYQLDGSESRNTTMAGHVTQTRVSRATWDGQALKIVTSYPGIDPEFGKTVHHGRHAEAVVELSRTARDRSRQERCARRSRDVEPRRL